jgi:multidrug resistance efflux pump
MTRKVYQRSAIAVAVIAIVGLIGVAVIRFTGTDQQAQAQQPAGRSGNPPPVAVEKPAPASTKPQSLNAARASTSQPAHVVPFEQAEILPKASGFVSRVHVDIGDMVEKDQVLAELWIPEMDQEILLKEAAVEEAKATVDQLAAAIIVAKSLLDAASAELREKQASVAQYEAEVAFRHSEHDRFVRLVAEKALNESLLDEKRKWLRVAESALAAAQAGVTSSSANIDVQKSRLKHAEANERLAVAQLKVAGADLKKTEVLAGYSQVKAPFGGMITDRRVDTGAFVASAASNKPEPLFSLCRVDRLRIVVDIPESEAPFIRVGQPVELKVDAIKDQLFAGSVKRTAGVLDTRTRTLRVEAELDSPPPELRPGMFGLLTINFDTSP